MIGNNQVERIDQPKGTEMQDHDDRLHSHPAERLGPERLELNDAPWVTGTTVLLPAEHGLVRFVSGVLGASNAGDHKDVEVNP